MKFFNKLSVGSTLAAAALFASVALGLGGHASAACTQYDPNSSIQTPVFNNFCGVPNGVGDEPDFVRIRQSANGNNEDNQNNPDYTNAVTAACNTGEKFDVRTYVHNNAASGFNNNGAGTSIAKNVTLNMTAPLNTTNTTFPFMSSISASNAAGVQDSATLSCGSKQVKLTLVPSSVHIYSQQYNWNGLPDSAVNGTTRLGSPVLGSGDVWGCWEYRIVVVYTVTVTEVPPVVVPSTGECKAIEDFVIDTKSRKVSLKVNGNVSNAQIVGYKIDWGDQSTPSDKQSDSHVYAKDGTYNIVASVIVKFADGHTETKTAPACNLPVTIAQQKENCTKPGKENLPADSPECKVTTTTTPPTTPTKPVVLPNTGAGNVVGIFGAVTIAGAFVHRFVLSRRYNG